MGHWLLQSSGVHEVVQAVETGQVHRVTSAAIEVGNDPTMVVDVQLVTCQLTECRLCGTSLEHPQYYLQKVLS
jgi:hypothetical protein